MVSGPLSSFQTTLQVPISEKPVSGRHLRNELPQVDRAESTRTSHSTTSRVHSEQTVASFGMADLQCGHNVESRPASIISRNNGPKMTACGNENRAIATALPFLADFEIIRAVPASPSPLQRIMYCMLRLFDPEKSASERRDLRLPLDK